MTETKPSFKTSSDFDNGFSYLQWVMQRLRDPDHGCPWDLEQTADTLTPYIIEESYELVEAIKNGSIAEQKDELGDVLFQVVFQAQLAQENGNFSLEQIATYAAEKMISRHPHVFGDGVSASTVSDVQEIWEAQKEKEGRRKENLNSSKLKDDYKSFPALMRSQKILSNAAKLGFTWQDKNNAFNKIVEELEEVKQANEQDSITEEIGDLLFAIVNYARMQKINAEDALQKAGDKFSRRFAGMEKAIAKNEEEMSDLTLERWLDYWQQQN